VAVIAQFMMIFFSFFPFVMDMSPPFVYLYAFVVLVGALSNVAVIWTVVKHRLYKDPTCGYIINLATADIFKCVLVLLLSRLILLEKKWIF
jgi:uncharacterized membrane protein